MRLNEFRQLSKKEQKKETARAVKRIGVAYKKLCRTGQWNENASKELKKSGETILWRANRPQ